MKLRRLHLKAFGPFTDRVLDFGTAEQRLVLVHGARPQAEALLAERFGQALVRKWMY